MAKKWSEVVTSEGFLSLTPEEQVEAQRQYFDTVVVPQAQEQGYDVNEVANQFFTENALSQGDQIEEEVEPTPDEMVLPEQGEVIQPEPVIEEPVQQTDWTPVDMTKPTPQQEASVWAIGSQQVQPETPRPQRVSEPPVYLTRAQRRSQRQQAGLDAQQPASVWGQTLEPALGLRPGYDATGAVDYSHPRWEEMDDYTIASQVAMDERQDVWDSIPSNFGDEDAYTRQVRANRDALIDPMRAPAPQQRGQEQMNADVMRQMYGNKPSMWDKVSPETLKENAIQASPEGATLLDDVYTKKARYIEQGYSPEEAEKEAFADAGRDALQFTAGVATAPVSVGAGMVGLAGRMALSGGVNALAGAVADEASDREVTTGKVLEDLAWGSLGGIGGGTAGKQVAKKQLGEGAKALKALHSEPIQQIDELAKQAQAKQSVADSLQNPRILNEALEGTQTITAKEMLEARNTIDILGKLNAKGASMDVTDILPTIKNEELRNLLTKATPVRNAAAKLDDVVEDLTGVKPTELMGMTTRAEKKATREAVTKVADTLADDIKWSKESLSIAKNFKGATKQEFEKVYGLLEKAQADIANGNFGKAKTKLAKLDDKPTRDLFGSTASDEINRITAELRTTLEAGKATKGWSAPISPLGFLNNIGVPAATAFFAHPAALVGIPLSKYALRKGARAANVSKLKDLERAFGGKLKIDDEAARMLERGEDMGVVAGYLVQRLMREE